MYMHQLIPNKIFIYCDLLFIDKYGNILHFKAVDFLLRFARENSALFRQK